MRDFRLLCVLPSATSTFEHETAKSKANNEHWLAIVGLQRPRRPPEKVPPQQHHLARALSSRAPLPFAPSWHAALLPSWLSRALSPSCRTLKDLATPTCAVLVSLAQRLQSEFLHEAEVLWGELPRAQRGNIRRCTWDLVRPIAEGIAHSHSLEQLDTTKVDYAGKGENPRKHLGDHGLARAIEHTPCLERVLQLSLGCLRGAPFHQTSQAAMNVCASAVADLGAACCCFGVTCFRARVCLEREKNDRSDFLGSAACCTRHCVASDSAFTIAKA